MVHNTVTTRARYYDARADSTTLKKMAVSQINQQIALLCEQELTKTMGYMLRIKVLEYKIQFPSFDMLHHVKWLFKQRKKDQLSYLETPFYMYPPRVLKFDSKD